MMYLLGTEYLPNMQDNILLIESYRTSPNECQRRFAQLKQYGIFDKVKGIVIGYNYDLQKNGDIYPKMEDILLEYTKEYDFPIIKCNDFGHKIANSVIPIGTNVRIDCDNKKIEIEEKEEYENLFEEDENIPEEIVSSAINSWLFNKDTIKKMLETLMEKGLKVEGGDKIRKNNHICKKS